MKYPESWLREWVDHGIEATELAHRLTMSGHEVDGVELDGSGLHGMVIGEVLSVDRHPGADRLTVCRVAAGEGEHIVICGAPNVAPGMKSVFIAPGGRLPGGTRIRRTKIRGVESAGMLCSYAELGLGDDADGIVSLPADAPAGEELAAYLGLPDLIFDIELTPNRGDCFSILGMAREIAAVTAAELTGPELAPVAPSIEDRHPVLLEDAAACPRFAARVIRGIDPAARSPLWLTERLRRSGLRAIHPVVDVTNYVMLELGQPMHAYDLGRLSGPIRPRFAAPGDRVVLLDGRDIAVEAGTIVISDDSGAIGLAGIMGGLATAVTDDTRDVFLEAAFWPRESVAGRARAYGLHTDASLRFERGVDPQEPVRAIERATRLLLDIAGGSAGPVTDVVHRNSLPENPRLRLRRSRLRRVLGSDIDPGEVSAILRRLRLRVTEDHGEWTVHAPSFRFDLEIEDDLIEEIARVHGYDRIPEITETAALPLRPVTERRVGRESITATLVARDYREVVTYSFIDRESNRAFGGPAEPLALANPISADMAVMRSSLWPGMLKVAAANAARQQERLRLFELGTTFHGTPEQPVERAGLAGVVLGPALPEQWGADRRDADFFDLKGDVEALLELTREADAFRFIPGEHPALQPGQAARILRAGKEVGAAGKLHPAIAASHDITMPVFLFELDLAAFAARVPRAQPVPRYPAIRRDLALLVAEELPVAELVEMASRAAPDIIRRVVVFDVYRGPGIEAGLKSVALGLILQETSRTLTDQDADNAMAAILARLQREFAAVLRD